MVSDANVHVVGSNFDRRYANAAACQPVKDDATTTIVLTTWFSCGVGVVLVYMDMVVACSGFVMQGVYKGKWGVALCVMHVCVMHVCAMHVCVMHVCAMHVCVMHVHDAWSINTEKTLFTLCLTGC